MLRKIVLPVSILSALLLAGCGNQQSKKADSSSKTTSSKVVRHEKAASLASSRKREEQSESSSIASSESASASSASSSRAAAASSQERVKSNEAAVAHALKGQNFAIKPMLFNGENVDKAMDDQHAPQSLAHDYALMLHFDGANRVRMKHLGTYNPTEHATYQISDQVIVIQKHQIPYRINNGTVSFLTWTESGPKINGKPSTITYKVLKGTDWLKEANE